MYVMSKRLDKVAKSNPIFEADQVLTPEALNGLFDYLDIQERLSRVELVGIGIVCGLEIKLLEKEGLITISKGLGLTTDGDLVRVDGNEQFEGFFVYREGESSENSVVHGGTEVKAYQLVNKVGDDPRAFSLSDFAKETGKPLSDLVAALFVENRVTDPDLCSSTDCDNLGRVYSTEVRLLLVDTTMAALLKEHIITPDSIARELRAVDIVVPRVLVAGMNSQDDLEKAYRAKCEIIRGKLDEAFKKLSEVRGRQGIAALDEVFPVDPTNSWKASLDTIRTSFDGFGSGIQYYYDFLRDVVETYEAFVDSLHGEMSICRPDYLDFPKHLLLGSLGGSAERATYRTGFYPSGVGSASKGRLARTRFLAKKLSALIANFTMPKLLRDNRIAITPSATEESGLEERAMPFYYKPETHETWNQALSERGKSDYVYSYHALSYNAKGAARSPLTAPIGRFGFFRVEGHLGMQVDAAVAEIEKQIRENNLPFLVRAVLLGRERGRIFRKPLAPGLVRYTDMHRLHRLVRHGLAEQVETAAGFGVDLEKMVELGDSAGNPLDGTAKGAVKRVSAQKGVVLSQSADKASAKLRKTFADYNKDQTWKDDVRVSLESASQLKSELRDVAKTEFVTPIDTLVGSGHLQWLDWMDDIVKEKEERAEERFFFVNFLAENPSMEHHGGVFRGGTLVLAHDAEGKVVADFMVPYACPEPEEIVAEPVPKPRPINPIRPPWLRPEHAITLDKPIMSKLDKLKLDTEVFIEKRVSTQDQAVRMLDKAVTAAASSGAVKPSEVTEIRDEILDLKLEELKTKSKQAKAYREKLFDPDLTASERAALEAQVETTEKEVAVVAVQSAKYVAEKNVSVEKGSDGVNAMRIIAASAGNISNQEAIDALNAGVNEIAVGSNAKLGGLIGAVKNSIKRTKIG